MIPASRHASTLVAAGAPGLARARAVGPDPPALRVNVAAVSAASARVAPPQDRLAAASRHIQSVLGPVHRWRENAEGHRVSSAGFAAPETPP